MKTILRAVSVLTLFMTWFGSFNSFAEDMADPRTVITKTLPEFSHIRIIDVTKSSPRFMWGYPGIWIKQAEGDEANITYNNVCTPYISTEITGDTLVVKLDQSFLYPSVTTWNPNYGMINAISINVPRKFGLKSVYNNGTYQYNTTIINFDCKSLAITSSNSFRIQNCKIKKLLWSQVEGMPLADRCEYSLLFKLSDIGTLSISEAGLPEFSMGNNIGSEIKKYECRK